jgi:hypothetical protein
MGIFIPIVFPEFKITVEVPKTEVDLLPWVQWDNIRKGQNANPKRSPYSILSNSCIHFVKDLASKAGITTPWMVDPRPNSYIAEFRDDFPDLDYDPKTNKLVIEGVGQF